MFRRCWVMVIAMFALGCATVGSGTQAVIIDENGKPVSRARQTGEPRVTAGELTELSSAHFGALEITFENTSSEWIRISEVQLDFGSPALNESIFIPAGEDLQSWQDAISTRNAIRQVNHETAIGLIALGAAVLGAVSDRGSAGEAVGGMALAGAVATLSVGQYQDRVSDAKSVKLFPSSHLLAGPFGVPPGLFVKRWVVLNTRGAAAKRCIRSAFLNYDTQALGRRRVLLNYRDGVSEWQENACDPRAR